MIVYSNQLTHCDRRRRGCANLHKALNSCIQVTEMRVNRRLTIPHQINFRLNGDILAQIEAIQAKNQQLKLSKSKLATLRYYFLLNLPLDTKANSAWEQLLPLNFTTNYIFPDNQNLTVVRSQIDFKGQISQQIQQDLWHNPQLLEKVVNTHHWLIKQILIQLPLKTPSHVLRLLKVIFFFISVIVSVCFWYFLPLNNLIKILIIICSFYLSQKHLITLIKQQAKFWFIKAMGNQFLSNTTLKRQIAVNILMILG
jgi:hypothetical protein